MLGNDARFFGLGARIVLVVIGVGALAVAIDSEPAWAGSSGTCISLAVDAPMLLPNGAVHPPGDLTLCDTIAVTPVSRIHCASMLLGPRKALAAAELRISLVSRSMAWPWMTCPIS